MRYSYHEHVTHYSISFTYLLHKVIGRYWIADVELNRTAKSKVRRDTFKLLLLCPIASLVLRVKSTFEEQLGKHN